jgi:lipopolysaccharide transport protein LptA
MSSKKLLNLQHIKTIALLISAAWTHPAAAAVTAETSPPGQEAPWEVQSDSYEILLDKRQITYVGNVVAEQGEYRIKADRMLAFFNENNELIRLEADGTSAVQAELEALDQPQKTRLLGDRLLYDMHDDRVTARGNTKLLRGTDTMDAHELVYNLMEERVVAMRSNEARVKVVMYPEGSIKPAMPE